MDRSSKAERGLAGLVAWLADVSSVPAEVARRRRILIHANLMFIGVVIFFAVRRVSVSGFDSTTLLIAVIAVALGAALPSIRWLGRHQPALVMTLAAAIFAAGGIAHQNGGLTAPATASFLGAPILAVFVGGRRSGLATSLVTALVLFALYALSAEAPTTPYIKATRLLAMVGSVGFVFAVASFFEAERMQTAEAIARSREDFRRLVNSSRDAVVVVRDARIVYANEAMAELFGFGTDARLVDRALVSVIHADDRDEMAPLIERLLRGDTSDDAAETSFRRPDGQRVTLVLHQVKNVHFGGEEGLLLVGRDIREKKKLEAQLRMADRLASVGSLAAGVAHEVNNPLTYVMNNLSYALDCSQAVRAGAPREELEDALEALTEAQDGARRVQRIVSDLQSFSRESTPEQTQVDLRRVITSAVKMANHELKHRARLREEHDDDLPMVWGDEPKLAQVFLNLLVNAAQATPTGRKDEHLIVVRSQRTGTEAEPRVVIEVSDTGRGIDETLLERVFDPFFTTKPIGEGTGLGLAISHGLVTSMGGTLSLRNNPQRGATACVELPAMSATSTALPVSLSPLAPPPLRLPQTTSLATPVAPTDTAPPDSSDKPRVLVVDDEPYVGQAIRRMLTPDYEVEVVRRGVDALERLSMDHFVAVLCDVMMPGMSGMDLYDEVSRLLPGDESRIVFMTGGAFTPEARAFLAVLEKDGRPRSLLKPFERDTVLDALGQCRAPCRAEGQVEGRAPGRTDASSEPLTSATLARRSKPAHRSGGASDLGFSPGSQPRQKGPLEKGSRPPKTEGRSVA